MTPTKCDRENEKKFFYPGNMHESEHQLDEVLQVLHEEVKVQHVVLLRGIEGFEKGGKLHSSHLLSLSFDLPLVVEFFDAPNEVETATHAIQKILEKGHIVTLPGQLLL